MPARCDNSKIPAEDELAIVKADITSRLAGMKSLSDKLDTSKWDLNDLRTYENLIEEKRQIQMNHHKLAVNDVASRPGQRKMTTADLKDSAGPKFSYDMEYASYRCTEEDACVLDGAESCHHEVCRRAVDAGLTYLEYDTVMHYDQRIAAAKTARMKDALRKQRDVQLLKDLKDDEEWKEKCIKKIKSFGKEAGNAIMAAASQITGWTPPQVEVELEPDTAPDQVGRALSKIRLSLLPPEKNTFGEIFIRRLIPATGIPLSWKNPTQYMEYLGPIQVSHVEAAIFHVRQILEINAMLYYETHFCLQRFLEEFRDLGQQKVLPNRRNRAGLTVAEALHNIKAAMSQDHSTKSAAETLKGPLRKVLKACVPIESYARSEMWKVQEDSAQHFSDPSEKLAEIKLKALDQSPMPSISKLALDRLEAINKEYCALGSLLSKAKTGLSMKDLADAALGHIQKLADDDILKLGSTCRSLNAALEALRKRDEPNSKNMQPYDELSKALLEADSETICMESRHNKDLMKEAEETDKDMKPVLTRLFEGDMNYHILPGMAKEESQLLLAEYLRLVVEKKSSRETFRDGWNDLIAHNMYRGVGEAFYVFRSIKKDGMYYANCGALTSLLNTSKKAVDLLTRSGNGVPEFFCEHYRVRWCLPSTFVRLLATLPHMSALNPQSARQVLQNLSQLIQGPLGCIPEEWRADLQSLGRVFLHTYGYLTLESMHAFGRADVEQVVLTLLFILGFHTLVIESAKQAKSNLDCIKSFVAVILKLPDSNQLGLWMQQTTHSLGKLIDTHGLCCTSPDSCMKYEDIAKDRSAAGKLRQPSSVEQKPTQPKNTLKTEIYPDNASQPPTVDSKLRLHKQILLDLIVKGPAKCPPLDRGKILKYCAFCIKLMGGLDGRLSGKNHHKHTDLELVNVLWQAFLYAEDIKSTAEPSSLNIGMHNHCNVWELIDSKEKTCGFVEGYRRQYRKDKDLQLLAQSFTKYAILNGKKDVLAAFGQKWESLRELAGDLPMRLEILLSYAQKDLRESLLHDANRLGAAYSRMDHTYSSDPEFPHLDGQYFLDLLELNTNWFEDYAAALVEETEISEGKGSAGKVRQAAENLVRLEKDDESIHYDDQDLATVLRAAQNSWIRSPHEDIIFSEDDDDYDEVDFLYGTGGGENKAMIIKPTTESIDDEADIDSNTVERARAEDAIRALRRPVPEMIWDDSVGTPEEPISDSRDRPVMWDQASQTYIKSMRDQTASTSDLAQIIDERGHFTVSYVLLNTRIPGVPDIIPASSMPANTADIMGVQNLPNAGNRTTEDMGTEFEFLNLNVPQFQPDESIDTDTDIAATVNEVSSAEFASASKPYKISIKRRKLIPRSVLHRSWSSADENKVTPPGESEEFDFNTSPFATPSHPVGLASDVEDNKNDHKAITSMPAAIRPPTTSSSMETLKASGTPPRTVRNVHSRNSHGPAFPFINRKPIMGHGSFEPSSHQRAELDREIARLKAEKKKLEAGNRELEAKLGYSADPSSEIFRTALKPEKLEFMATNGDGEPHDSLSSSESTSGDGDGPYAGLHRAKAVTREMIARMMARGIADLSRKVNEEGDQGKRTLSVSNETTSRDEVYKPTACHPAIGNDNGNSLSSSDASDPPSPKLSPAVIKADLINNEPTSPPPDFKSPKTDASFKTAQTSQTQDIQPTATTGYAVQSFHNQLLALKTSMSSIQNILAPNSTPYPFRRFTPFENINQKAHLAELQCEYMLNTLTNEQAEGEMEGDKGTKELLEEIEEIGERIAKEVGVKVGAEEVEDEVD